MEKMTGKKTDRSLRRKRTRFVPSSSWASTTASLLVPTAPAPSSDTSIDSLDHPMSAAAPTTVINGSLVDLVKEIGGITMKGQDKLPHLPIPPLADTMQRYVRALEGLQVRHPDSSWFPALEKIICIIF